MKTYSTAITSYRTGNGGYWQRNFLTFVVRDRTTLAAVTYNFWDGDDNVTVEVRNQSTGALEFRDYWGGGHLLELDPIVRSEGTGVRNISIRLSGVSTQVLDMIQGYDCRDAVFEWHVGEAEESTGILVDTPVCEFEGFIDTVSLTDGSIDVQGGQAESSFEISIASHISTLLRPNPDVRSLEVGQERSGDDIFAYADAANTWMILWGKGGKKHKGDRRGRRRNNDRPGDNDPWNDHT